MPRTIQRTVYKFSELSEAAKETARDHERSGDYPHDDWWDSTHDDAKRVGDCLGLDFIEKEQGRPCIYFSGFCSQGDGASFEANWNPEGDIVKAVIEHAPQDNTLKSIAEGLMMLCVHAAFKGNVLWGTVRTDNSNYSHSNTMTGELTYFNVDADVDGVPEDDDKEFLVLMRRFADWIYDQLNAEYDYLNSEEHIDKRLSDSDEEFDEDGHVV